MKRVMPVLVVMAMFCSILFATPALAFHEEMGLIHEESIDGPSWIAVRFDVAEGEPSASDLAFGIDDASTDGDWILNFGRIEQVDAPGSFAGWGGGGCGDLLGVEIYANAGDLAEESFNSRAGGCGGSTFFGFGVAPGSYRAVFIVGSDGDLAGNLQILAAENATVLGVTSGPAFDAADRDFGGVVNSQVITGAGEAQAIVGGAVSTSVEAPIYGFFSSDGNSLMSVEGPEGPSDTYMQGEPAGDYTFSVTKADASAVFWSRTWVLVAGVIFPTV